MPSVDTHVTAIQLNPETEWYRITLDDDRIKQVETKLENLAKEAVEIKKSGLLARIEYSERDSRNINPHTNKPYVNRYYERGTTLGDKQETLDGIEVLQPAAIPGRKTDPTDAWRMTLAKAGELAVATMPMMPVEQRTFENQKRIAWGWASFIYFSTPPPMPAPEPSVFQSPAGSLPSHTGHPGAYDDPPTSDAAPPHGDEDIPF